MNTNAMLAYVLAAVLFHAEVASAQSAPATAPAASAPLVLVREGKPACTLVVAGSADGWLMRSGVEAVRATIERWTGAKIPMEQASTLAGRLPSQGVIILGTLEDLRHDLPKVVATIPWVERVAFLDEQGFVCTPARVDGVPCVLVVGRTPRGTYNGAVWLRDFGIDGTRGHLELTCAPVVRTPCLPGRAVYTLTIWGQEAEYTAADWETIFNSFARDGFDRVYFWVSGHFPSKHFPQACKCRDDKWDTTEKSRIATVEDLQRIIRAGHDRGLKVYAGGALGGWCCTYALTNLAPGTMKTPKDAPYPAPSSLCPSHPMSRRALIDYYQEVFDGLPEADGLFIESADEWGGCHCPTCSRKIDEKGSTQFGQAQITLVQEIMQAVWNNHPQARLCYTIGYGEHRQDPAYYALIRQMSDPRMEWMEARDSWSFPGPTGQDLPSRLFSRQVMRWQQYYAHPLEKLVNDSARVGAEGLFGLITAFEPGFSTGSFHTEIPFPTDALPYVLTGFVWREATWSPAPTSESIRASVQRRFFGREASAVLGEDLWTLRELIREAVDSRKRKPALTEKLAVIEAHVQQARTGATPKTSETLDLMSAAIHDVQVNMKPN